MACLRYILISALLAGVFSIDGSNCAAAQIVQAPTFRPGQQSIVSVPSNNPFAVSSPMVPDYANAGPGSQHLSMSPDGWDTSQRLDSTGYPAPANSQASVPALRQPTADAANRGLPQQSALQPDTSQPEMNSVFTQYGSTSAADVTSVLGDHDAPPTPTYPSTSSADMKMLEQPDGSLKSSPFQPAGFRMPTSTMQADEPQWQPPAAMIVEQPLVIQDSSTPQNNASGRYPLFETNPAQLADPGTYRPVQTPSMTTQDLPDVNQAANSIAPQANTAPLPMSTLPAIMPVESFSPSNVSGPIDSVGRRRPWPIQRANLAPLDDGEKFPHESKKRDYPPFDEIINTGRFFYSAEVLWGEPQFQGNTAISTEATNFGESIPFDFDSDFHPRVRLGFESKYGPGVELSYFNLNSNSELESFTSNGSIVGHSNAWVIGRNEWSRIFADDPGETLVTQHSIDIDSAAISFFKELQFPISRINGNFGFQYVSIAQELNANVNDAGGGSVESLRSTTDMRAFGPRVILEYYRPVGHTPLEFVTSFGGSVLFGQRDQFVSNSQSGLLNRVGADEFLTILDFMVGAQYTKTVGENRAWFARFGFVNQTWIGGGTAAFPQGDFGIRGLTFGIGYNR